jgi:hypothetical protein
MFPENVTSGHRGIERSWLANSTFGPKEIGVIKRRSIRVRAIHFAARTWPQNSKHTDASPASSVRLGIASIFWGDIDQLLRPLKTLMVARFGFFLQRQKAHLELGNFSRAIACYESAKLSGSKRTVADCVAEAKRQSGDIEVLGPSWKMFLVRPDRPPSSYQRGATLAALGTNPDDHSTV